MDAFFKTHAYLVEHTNAPVRRALMDEINWDDRMIGIKGTRGIGKTTFLLQYAKEHFTTSISRDAALPTSPPTSTVKADAPCS